MSFDIPWILVNLLSSVVGITFFRQGKKSADIFVVFCGLILILDGYGLTSAAWLATVNVFVALAPWARNRFLS